MGVQTFCEKGLKWLTRNHSGSKAVDSLSRAKGVFDNINVDLIYGWPGQSLEIWDQDLQQCLIWVYLTCLYIT